jgi:hypothetical protein
MAEVTYRISRCEDGWAISVPGARLRFDTLDCAIRGATLAVRADRLSGREASIAVEQGKGTWETRRVT